MRRPMLPGSSARFLRRGLWWLALGYLAVLLLVCLLPVDKLPPINASDKLEHMLAFVLFAVLYRLLFPRAFWAVLIAGIVLGAGIELAQGFTGYRDAEWLDLLADGSGLLLGSLGMSWWFGRSISARLQRALANKQA